MRADLGDSGAGKYDDEIGHPHRGKSVRHEDRDPSVTIARVSVASRADLIVAAGGGGVAFEQRVLRLGVEGGCRLVEHQE